MDLIPRNSFFEDAMDLMNDSLFKERNFMKTDMYEKDGAYILEMDMPGLKKEDIHMEFNNGYLTVEAEKESHKEEKGKYLRQERFYGSMKRSFYVGDVNEENIKASFENGTLKVSFPKQDSSSSRKQISID